MIRIWNSPSEKKNSYICVSRIQQDSSSLYSQDLFHVLGSSCKFESCQEESWQYNSSYFSPLDESLWEYFGESC